MARAQVHTIEGLLAAVLILVAAVTAVQTVAITSTSSSTASPEIEYGLDRLAESVLTQAEARGSLKRALLRWNTTQGEFAHAEEEFYYRGSHPPGTFGRTLNWTLTQQGIAYNVDLVYEREAGDKQVVPFVDNGEPSENAVIAREPVVLTRTDRLWDGTQLPESNYPVARRSQSGLYNVVEVRLVVWRI